MVGAISIVLGTTHVPPDAVADMHAMHLHHTVYTVLVIQVHYKSPYVTFYTPYHINHYTALCNYMCTLYRAVELATVP